MQLDAEAPERMREDIADGLIEIVIAIYLKVVQTADK